MALVCRILLAFVSWYPALTFVPKCSEDTDKQCSIHRDDLYRRNTCQAYFSYLPISWKFKRTIRMCVLWQLNNVDFTGCRKIACGYFVHIVICLNLLEPNLQKLQFILVQNYTGRAECNYGLREETGPSSDTQLSTLRSVCVCLITRAAWHMCNGPEQRIRYSDSLRAGRFRESNPGGARFPHPSRPVLGPNQPSIQWVPGDSRGVKWPERGVHHSPHPEQRLKKK